jgi:hypothetical protein
MSVNDDQSVKVSGGCLCGEVRYEVQGPLRNVINCHCSKCRRTHGHLAAYTSVRREYLLLTRQGGLKWYRSVTDETPNVHRGFCKECGSSLFWDPKGIGDNIAISAGSLDSTTGLKTIGHVWVSQAGNYYEITDDLPRFEKSHEGQLG